MKYSFCISFILSTAVIHLSYGQEDCEEQQECPTWFVLDTSSTNANCKCGNSLSGIVRCKEPNSTSLNVAYCMTYSCDYNSTFVGRCPFSRRNTILQQYMELPPLISEVNSFMCGRLNRTGLLCSECMDGLGTATLSHIPYCLKCRNSFKGWALYFFLLLFPLTVFFFAIVLFQIQITSPAMNLFIMTAQLMAVALNRAPLAYMDSTAPLRSCSLLLITFYGFWNLDFFRYVLPPFCVSEKLTRLHILTLEYIPALYPLFLIAVTYTLIKLHGRNCKVMVWLWNPFHRYCTHFRKKWDPKASIIHAFATFLLLSYSKLIFVSYSLLDYTTVYDNTGDHFGQYRLYYSTNIAYLSSQHIPFFILAISVLVVLVVPFTLFLFLYPTRLFQRCMGCCGWGCLAVHTFADIFNGRYKNGTNGTHDCRYFAGIYLFYRILFVAVITITARLQYVFIVGSMVPIAVALLIAFLHPYRNNWFNIIDCVYNVLLTLFNQLYLYNMYIFRVPNAIMYTYMMVPFLYFFVYLAYRLLLYLGFFQRCCQSMYLKLKKTCHSGTDSDDILPDRITNPSHYIELTYSENSRRQ